MNSDNNKIIVRHDSSADVDIKDEPIEYSEYGNSIDVSPQQQKFEHSKINKQKQNKKQKELSIKKEKKGFSIKAGKVKKLKNKQTLQETPKELNKPNNNSISAVNGPGKNSNY